MRPTSFDPSVLRQHLRRHKISELVDLKRALGTDTDLTVFRKLKQLGYHASYTHRGRFYTLAEIARFDEAALHVTRSDSGFKIRERENPACAGRSCNRTLSVPSTGPRHDQRSQILQY